LSVAVHKCSGVAESARHRFVVFSCVHYQAKVDDGEIAVLMNLKILSFVGRVRSGSGRVLSVRQDVFLGDYLTCSSRIDNVVGKEAIESCTLIFRNIVEKCLDQRD